MSSKNPAYSARSFLYIDARESRRRKTPASEASAIRPEIESLKGIRDQVAGAKSRKDQAELDSLMKQRTRVRKRRDEKVKSLLFKTEHEFKRDISDHRFRWNLNRTQKIRGRQIFQIERDLSHFYVAKQCEYILRKDLRHQPSNRNTIVRALHDALNKNFTYGVIRTDIEHFYDEVPHDQLRQALRERMSLDPITLELVDILLNEYSMLTGSPIGLPQGVSISASLSEIYLEQLDHRLRITNGVLFYARYVDDIVVIVEDPDSLSSIRSVIESEFCKIGLKPNTQKTQVLSADDTGALQGTFDFLGYTFSHDDHLKIELSEKSLSRKMARLDGTFTAWAHHPSDGLATKLFMQRILFLTSNFRLHNSKSNAIAGLYFSNRELPADSDQLRQLDKHLAYQIEQYANQMPEGLRAWLNELSFVTRFKERSFVRFNAKDLHNITMIWER